MCFCEEANVKMDIHVALSGLERMREAVKRVGGTHSWNFHCEADDAFRDMGKEALAQETMQALLGDEQAQQHFLRNQRFQYHSSVVGNVVEVTVEPES